MSTQVAFGSLHTLAKLNGPVLDLWCQLLHAVPSARLLVCRDTLVGEARKRLGEDSRLCADGVLVYTVDASVRSGYGPIRVHAAERDTSQDQLWKCGPLYAAQFATGNGRVPLFVDAAAGVTVRVLGSTSAGYRVLVSRTSDVHVSSIHASRLGNADAPEAAPPRYWGLSGFLSDFVTAD